MHFVFKINKPLANPILKSSIKNFCYRFIPFKKLKFINIPNEYEKGVLIYQQDPNDNNTLNPLKFKLRNTIKPFSLGILLTLFVYPNLPISYIMNAVLQPLLLYKLIINNKTYSSLIFNVYLLKNGQQLLIQTYDNSTHIINIKEINVNQNKPTGGSANKNIYNFETQDKNFIIYKGSKTILDQDVLSAALEKRYIDTKNCLMYYNRSMYPK